MVIILKKSSDYILQTEKLAGSWWLELVERKTGMSQIMYCRSKQQAFNFFDKIDDLEVVRKYYDDFGLKQQKMYKENYGDDKKVDIF